MYLFKLEASAVEVINEVIKNPSFLSKLLQKFLDFLPTLLTAAIVYILGCVVNKVIIRLLGKGLKHSRIDKTVHGFLESVVKVTLLCLIVIIVLAILGIPTTSIIAVLGSAGIAIGLALKDSLSNIAGGVIVLMGKTFRVGDYVSINETEGVVREISIFSTNMVTVDNKSIYIPNGIVANATIVNFTKEKTRRVDHTMSISYDNDVKKAISVIKSVLDNNAKILVSPEPFVRICAYSASSVDITVRAWVNSDDYWDVYFDLLEEIKEAFDKNSIVIPYNQIDVHMIGN